MTRENILFAVIGLLFGYLVAFHLVVYVNQSQPARVASAASADSSGNLPPDHPAVPSNDVKDRQRLQSAAERAAQSARSDPQNFDAQVAAANAYFQAGAFEQAIDFLTSANNLRPDDYDTLVWLGNAYASADKFDDAEKWYKAALAKRPDDYDTRAELAITYYLRVPKQTEKAMAELRHNLEQKPDHVPSLHYLSAILIEQKQFSEAEATLARLEKADPGYEQLPQLREELDKAKRGATTGADDKAQKKTQGD
jgi:tetratricopeptide (TPR) repeat protein